jgi:hypothetical protein
MLTDLADPALSPNCVPMNSQRVILSGAVKPPGSFCAYVHPGVVIRVGYPRADLTYINAFPSSAINASRRRFSMDSLPTVVDPRRNYCGCGTSWRLCCTCNTIPSSQENNEGAMTETKTKAIEDNRCAGWSLVTTACKGEERPSGLAEGNVVSGYGGNRLLLARFGFITK